MQASETPLHFASKFGAHDCVKLLLSHPTCNTDKVNAQGKKAAEIICERKGDHATNANIAQLFENQYYVPVMRTDDEVIVSHPIKGFTPNKNTAALAGPTSPELANKLFKYLKSPVDKKSPASVRLRDSVKGLERDASNKCKEIGVQWTEYWEFLDARIDLASDEGLAAMEQHLRKISGVSDDVIKDADITSTLHHI